VEDEKARGGGGEEGEVEEAPAEVAHAEEVHGGKFDEERAGHVHVAELAVGRPATLDEEGDVVNQRGVAEQRPAPGPGEEEECGDGEAGRQGEAKEARWRETAFSRERGRHGQVPGFLPFAQNDNFLLAACVGGRPVSFRR
jgi:hypothetical protein